MGGGWAVKKKKELTLSNSLDPPLGGLILLAQVWPLRMGGVKPISEPLVFNGVETSNEKGNCTHSTVGSSDTNVMGHVQVWIWYSVRRVS